MFHFLIKLKDAYISYILCSIIIINFNNIFFEVSEPFFFFLILLVNLGYKNTINNNNNNDNNNK